jgi:hypothetical protein
VDVAMTGLRQTIADELEEESDQGGSDFYLKWRRVNNKPATLGVASDDEGTLPLYLRLRLRGDFPNANARTG